MNRFATLFAAAACCAFAAHAGMKVDAREVPHITNGGTGFIGVTASAGMTDRMTTMSDATMKTTRTAGMPSTSQEADPSGAALRTLGSGPAASDPRMHRAWGTPD